MPVRIPQEQEILPGMLLHTGPDLGDVLTGSFLQPSFPWPCRAQWDNPASFKELCWGGVFSFSLRAVK